MHKNNLEVGLFWEDSKNEGQERGKANGLVSLFQCCLNLSVKIYSCKFFCFIKVFFLSFNIQRLKCKTKSIYSPVNVNTLYYLRSHCLDQDVEYFFSPGYSIVLLYCTCHHRLFYLSQKFIEVESYSLLQFCVWLSFVTDHVYYTNPCYQFVFIVCSIPLFEYTTI